MRNIPNDYIVRITDRLIPASFEYFDMKYRLVTPVIPLSDLKIMNKRTFLSYLPVF